MKPTRATLGTGLALLLVAGLAGCADLDQMEHDNYARACEKLGIGASSPDFNQCMLQQQRLNEQNVQNVLDREALEGK